MTDNTPAFPFVIHGLDAAGLDLVISAKTVWTAQGTTMYPGDLLEVTEAIWELNKSASGRSWLNLSHEEQIKKWGRARFGIGEAPGHVIAANEAARHAALAAEIDTLRRQNPHLMKQTAASLRLRSLEAERAALSLKSSGE